jgi:hypothetical protein
MKLFRQIRDIFCKRMMWKISQKSGAERVRPTEN